MTDVRLLLDCCTVQATDSGKTVLLPLFETIFLSSVYFSGVNIVSTGLHTKSRKLFLNHRTQLSSFFNVPNKVS